MVDVVIVGSGIMGACLGLSCAERGLSVEILEAGLIPDPQAPSNGDTRLFRMAYFEAPDYVPLLRTSHEAWKQWNRRLPHQVFHERGVLFVGNAETALMRGAAASVAQHQLKVRQFSVNELRKRWPEFQFADDDLGMMDMEGGWIDASLALRAILQAALLAGVTMSPQESVTRVEEGDGGVTIYTAERTIRAGQAVLCSGLGLGDIWIGNRRFEQSMSRQVLTYWMPEDPARFARSKFPAFAFEEPNGNFYYGVPLNGEAVGIKIALHNEGSAVEHPLNYDVLGSDVEAIRTFVRRRVSGSFADFLSARVCHYEMLGSNDFALGFVPGCERIGVVASTAGHGFKFGPGVAAAMVDLLVDGDDSGIPPRLRASRLQLESR